MTTQHTNCRRSGFNLITLSVVLLAASMIFVSFLPAARNDLSRYQSTSQKLERVKRAMTGFMAKNGRRPCPAAGSNALNTANFGVEAANPGSCTGGTPAAPLGPDAGTGEVVAGTIPTRTLGLDDSYAFDEWGRRITYVVDKRATKRGIGTGTCSTLQNYPTNNGTGGIVIHDDVG